MCQWTCRSEPPPNHTSDRKMRLLPSLVWLALLGALGRAARPEDNALFEAVNKDDMGLIKAALEAGANIDVQGPGGQSPLMHAVLGGKVAAVKFLLKRGADASIAEKDGYTPMHGAGFQGRAQIARLLIEHGLDPRGTPHDDGFQPIHRAVWGGEQRHTDTVKVFLDAGVHVDEAAKNGQRPIEMVRSNQGTRRLLLMEAKLKHGDAGDL